MAVTMEQYRDKLFVGRHKKLVWVVVGMGSLSLTLPASSLKCGGTVAVVLRQVEVL